MIRAKGLGKNIANQLSKFFLNVSFFLRAFLLEVPGLLEKRPSVLNGDVIKVSIVGRSEDVVYEGKVTQDTLV